MKTCKRSVRVYVGGLILLSVVAFYGGAVPAAERIGIATEIASLRRVLGDASERLDSDNLNQDIQFVELLDASREIRGLLNRLTIRLERAKPVIKDNSELVRLARFIEEFETHVNDLEDAGQEDDLPAGRRALSLMSRALTEMDPDAPAPPAQLPEDISVKLDVSDDVAIAPEEAPVVEKSNQVYRANVSNLYRNSPLSPQVSLI